MGSQRITWLPEHETPRFDGVDSWGHTVAIGGAPGEGGAKPSDLLPLSLAACTAHDVVVILRKQRQDLRGLEIAIESVQDPDPPWAFTTISLVFRFTGVVDEMKARRAIELSERKYCAVAAAIASNVRVESSIEITPEGPGAPSRSDL